MPALFGLSLPELTERMIALGEKPYRARQLWEALYRERVTAVEQVTTFSADLRARLQADGDTVGLPQIVQTATSVDGTERYLIRMDDGETVETVWMPDGDGAEAPYEDDEAEAAAESRISRNVAVAKRNQALAVQRLPHGGFRSAATASTWSLWAWASLSSTTTTSWLPFACWLRAWAFPSRA